MTSTPSLDLMAPGLLRCDPLTLVKPCKQYLITPVFPPNYTTTLLQVNCVSGSPHLAAGATIGGMWISLDPSLRHTIEPDRPSQCSVCMTKTSNKVTTSCKDCAPDVTAEQKRRSAAVVVKANTHLNSFDLELITIFFFIKHQITSAWDGHFGLDATPSRSQPQNTLNPTFLIGKHTKKGRFLRSKAWTQQRFLSRNFSMSHSQHTHAERISQL